MRCLATEMLLAVDITVFLLVWIASLAAAVSRPARPTDLDDEFRSLLLKRRPKQSQNVTHMVSRLLHNYDNQDPPSTDKPTDVKLGIYINSFHSISEQTMDYSVSMYLRQAWNDPRLAFHDADSKMKKIRLDPDVVWVPDTFLRNEKEAKIHLVSVVNRLLHLSANGDLWYVSKVSATLSCPMMLRYYPLDIQSCPMMFESFGYTMDTVYFSWIESPVEVDADLRLSHFTLEEKILYDCSQNYTAGSFPCLEIRFILSRDIGYFLIQVYVPSILVVILSWLSFWINIEGSPARVSLGLLTVLTTTTMSAGARASLPRVSYIKASSLDISALNSNFVKTSFAVDVWMIICLLFVFSSLIEYAVVNVLARSKSKTAVFPRVAELAARTLSSHRCDAIALRRALQSGRPSYGDSYDDGMKLARRLDHASRLGFPLAFVCFNVGYWYTYSQPSYTSS